jgi:predicted AAA+ superfamily ATPase
MEKLIQKYYNKYALTQTDTVRDFVNTIDWSDRFTGIKGSRGVGKTTLLLQYIKQNYELGNTALYVSLDDMYFSENSLYDLANSFYKKGGELLAVDEVHRYKNWAVEFKNIYDDMQGLKVVFTGSSLLHLQKGKADLSRRAVMYNMPGLSYREFLHFEKKVDFPRYTLGQIVENHVIIAMEIVQRIKPLAGFENYLNYGYYPFYMDNINTFHQKLDEIILTDLEIDLPQFASIIPANIVYLKKLLRIISNSVPFKPNMNSLSERTGISLNTLKNYVNLLKEVEVLKLLYFEDRGINSLNKPEKMYLNNTNLMYNQSDNGINKGNIRETFFFNQVSVKHKVNASKKADFLVDNRYTFEIGGKNKSQKQLSGVPNSYVVKDDIEIGNDNIIPLWLFGFLY